MTILIYCIDATEREILKWEKPRILCGAYWEDRVRLPYIYFPGDFDGCERKLITMGSFSGDNQHGITRNSHPLYVKRLKLGRTA